MSNGGLLVIWAIETQPSTIARTCPITSKRNVRLRAPRGFALRSVLNSIRALAIECRKLQFTTDSNGSTAASRSSSSVVALSRAVGMRWRHETDGSNFAA